jgi:O-antigen biosynthesis protein
VFRGCGSSTSEIAAVAAEARARYGTVWHTMEPLYGLADFCFVVRRDVVDAVGAADERYGLGPCWEIDYTTRAVRAGFRPVWVQGSYVYRHPFTARRQRNEQLLAEACKRLYQDKFCGRRLRGERAGYAFHCSGDACPHFAPPDLITKRIPLYSSELVAAAPQQPLASCIMPTRDRTDWMLQAIHFFERQDYSERELIIVDDSARNFAASVPSDPRIRYIHLSQRLSISAKRNVACELAKGEIIIHWDDDDWYAPNRISEQVEPIIQNCADITGLFDTRFFDLEHWTFWSCTPELHRRLFVLDVHGGTLAFRRTLFGHLVRYPNKSLREDADFLRRVIERGARLARVRNDGLFLYVRHGTNAWQFPCGRYVDPSAWQRCPEPPELAKDRSFYATRSISVPAETNGMPREETRTPAILASERRNSRPLVSCIMPTWNRRPYVARAVKYFLAQNYPERELIIIDDGDDAVIDIVPEDSRVRYLRQTTRSSLGAKRNAACQAARGEIIVHWDDDDWNAAWRISYQAEALLERNVAMCGLSTLYFLDPSSGCAWEYSYTQLGVPWLCGNSLCYRKSFWQDHPFPSVNIGEDAQFVRSDPGARVLELADPRFLIAIIHPGNVSPKRPRAPAWRLLKLSQIQETMGPDWRIYSP